MVSCVAGCESFGLVAGSESVYYETIEFYASLGFVEIRSFAKEEGSSQDPVYCGDSIREAWLMNFDEESDETVTLKVRLVPDAEGLGQRTAHRDGQDWRSHSGQLSFKCRDLHVSVDDRSEHGPS